MSDTGPGNDLPGESLNRNWEIHNESALPTIESVYPVWRAFSGTERWIVSSGSTGQHNEGIMTSARQRTPPVASLLPLLVALVATPAIAAGKPMKVYVLAGQSNMEGQAVVDLDGKDYNDGKGTLVALLADPAKAASMAHLKAADGTWRVEGSENGRSPVLAFEADGQVSRPWRVAVWSLDGGQPSIRVTAQTKAPQDQALGDVAITPTPLGDLGPVLHLASVKVPGAQSVMLKGEGFVVGSRPGRPLAADDAGVQAIQSERFWIMSRAAKPAPLRVDAVAADAGSVALALRSGDIARLPQLTAGADSLTLWRAESSFGQPGLDAGSGMGVAPGSAVAIGGGVDPVRIWNAGSADGLRLRVDHASVRLLPPSGIDGHLAVVLAPGSAQRVALPEGSKQVRMSLAAGVLAQLSGGARETIAWTGEAPLSRMVTGAWRELLLVNSGAAPAPAEVSLLPTAEEPLLQAGRVVKRFFGAAGQVSLPVHAVAGDRILVAGGDATYLASDGRVLRGRRFEPAVDGELVIDHGVGLVVAWVESDSTTPWGVATSEPAKLPQSMALGGMARSVGLHSNEAVLLSARTSAPVIVALRRGGQSDLPELYASGAEVHRYLPAGDADLLLYSPQDGPLSGELQLSAVPVIPVQEGLGPEFALAPGASLIFGFEVKRAGNIGFGLRSTPDRATARLLDASGRVIADGVAQMKQLTPGRYLLEARAPADGETLIVRPAVIGITPPDSGPPPDVARRYLELVGLSPNRSR